MCASPRARSTLVILAAVALALALIGIASPSAIAQEAAGFAAYVDEDAIGGSGFGGAVVVTIADPTDGERSWSGDAISYEGDGFDLWLDPSSQEDPWDVRAGQTVTVAGPAATKSLLVARLTIDAYDLMQNTVTGTSDGLGGLWLTASHAGIEGGIGASIVDGSWTADFDDATPPFDLRVIDEIRASLVDDDGDTTDVRLDSIGPPRFALGLELQEVVGRGWPQGATLTLTVDRPATPANPDHLASAIAGGELPGGWMVPTIRWGYDVYFDLTGAFVVHPGDVLTMTDGTTTKVQTVPNLSVDLPNAATNSVSGATSDLSAGGFLAVGPDSIWATSAWLEAVPAADGSWSVSFAGEYDVAGAWAAQVDADGDITGVNAPVPQAWVDPAADRIWAVDFGPGDVTLAIDRAGVIVHTATAATVHVLTRGSWNIDMWARPVGDLARPAVALYDLAGAFDVRGGDRIVVTDETSTRQVTVADLTVGSVNAATDVVAGGSTADVTLHLGDGEAGYWGYTAVPSDGAWSYHFDPNEFPNQGLDPGMLGQAIVGQTVIRWSVPSSYVFGGFEPPVDTGAVNRAKAGQPVPVRWTLSDGSGDPVTDPSSFRGLYSYQVTCAEFSGDPVDAIEEYAVGSSGLRYVGGAWQYNWKTAKSYAGTCRVMYVGFSDGTTSPPVSFSFR